MRHRGDKVTYDARLEAVSSAIVAVEPPGDFFVSDVRTTYPPPAIVVDGMGDLLLPLNESVAQTLIEKCHLAPYGHREKTLIDTQVRNTWELAPPQFRIENPDWQPFIDQILESSRMRLGIPTDSKIQAKLYNMLVYEEGGKFNKHRDSEKEDGMFGTLVVVLPSRFEGGELIVHDPTSGEGRSGGSLEPRVWDPSNAAAFAVKFAAFYGDCPHEVKPVTKGYRLCLTYNLVTVGMDVSKSVPRFSPKHELYAALKAALCAYFTQENTNSKKQRLNMTESKTHEVVAKPFDLEDAATHRLAKLVYVLNHKYTSAGLSFRHLKNKDALVAASLAQFCEESKGAFELFLAKAEFMHEWHGNGDLYTSDSDNDDGDSDDIGSDEWEEFDLRLPSPWVTRKSGNMAEEVEISIGTYDCDEEDNVECDLAMEVTPTGYLNRKLEFDSRRDAEYTGNEGSKTERWYRSAALVLVPVALGFQYQFLHDEQEALASWCSLVDENPTRAIAVAAGMSVPEREWSLCSGVGPAVLDAAKKLNSVYVIQNLLSGLNKIEYQPKLREAMASFTWTERAEVVKHMSKVMRGRNRNVVWLVISILEGETDSEGIATVLNAMEIKGDNLDEENYKLTDDDSPPCEVERVLRLAYAVSADFLQQFVLKQPYASLVVQFAPALLHLIETTEGELRQEFRPVAQALVEKIQSDIPAVRHRSYERLWVSCPDTLSKARGYNFYGYCPSPASNEPCVSCTRLMEFLKSPTELTKEFGTAKDVHAVASIKRLKSKLSDGKYVVRKTYDNRLVVKGRAIVDRLKAVVE